VLPTGFIQELLSRIDVVEVEVAGAGNP